MSIKRELDFPAEAVPPPDSLRTAVGHMAFILEKRLPGFTDEWLDSLECEAVAAHVIRLREPREEPEVRRERAKAVAWVRRVRLVTMAWLGTERRPKKGRK